ncbi:hypothetical protein Bca4012_065768 [Brassica carinata]
MNPEPKVLGKEKLHYSKIIGKAQVQEKQQKQQGFPHFFHRLSTFLHPLKQETSPKYDMLSEGSINTDLLEEVVKKGMKKKKNI